VTLPSAGNLGGGGFLLLRKASGEAVFVDFRERAPAAAHRDMYLDAEGKPTKDSTVGWRAAGVPGTVRGLEFAHKKYGRARWSTLVDPSVKLAQRGFVLNYATSRSIAGAKLLAQFPESNRIFLRNGKPYEAGETFTQPELARTLKRLRRFGAKDFYEGQTARILAEESAKAGGLIALEDLKSYRAIEREPLRAAYKGLDLLLAPPPSSGGILIAQMLGILEASGYEKTGAGSAQSLHWIAEAMKRAYADRAEYLGDPDFVKVPVTGLTSRTYIDRMRASIDPAKAIASAAIRNGPPPAAEPSETTHLSVVDAEGNAVALTYTINGSYGNGVTVPRLGFLLNNEMDDFSVKPGAPNMFGAVGGTANAIAPRKTPLSSMSPLIAAREGKLFLALGAPGGTRIPNGVLQAFLNVVDFGMNLQEAIDAPRIHHQWLPDRLQVTTGVSPDTIELLKRRGHNVAPTAGVALVEGIAVRNGWLEGGSDTASRQRGRAAGY
jgi:gamma-glutamyltranspeptidase/glutathione hydrolase